MNSEQPPELLYHYTSAAGALGILQGRTIWASMVHYMNDGHEFLHALTLAREILLQAVPAGDDEASFRTICGEYLGNISLLAIFAFSLSREKDLLSQWRAYCPPEGGFALGFSSAKLRAVAEVEGFQLVRCEYDRTRQLALLQPVVEDMLTVARELGPEARGIELHPTLTSRLAVIGAALKHPSFAEEREWRLISVGGSSPAIRHRAERGLFIPYYEIPMSGALPFPVELVRVGPHRNPELARRSVHSLTASVRKWPFKVEFTETPFRVLG